MLQALFEIQNFSNTLIKFRRRFFFFNVERWTGNLPWRLIIWLWWRHMHVDMLMNNWRQLRSSVRWSRSPVAGGGCTGARVAGSQWGRVGVPRRFRTSRCPRDQSGQCKYYLRMQRKSSSIL